jgi:uncharacterized protein
MKNQADPWADGESEPDAGQLLQAYKMLNDGSAQAISDLTELAERGSSMSMLYLGYAFTNGVGVASDLAVAEKWYRLAADAGLTRAYYNLGRLHLANGQYLTAKQEFEVAASKEFMPAIHYLGRMYYFGYGVPVDGVRGKALLEKASKWGCVGAKATLAYDLIHRKNSLSAKVEGILMRVECYFEFVWVLCTEGIASDRFR